MRGTKSGRVTQSRLDSGSLVLTGPCLLEAQLIRFSLSYPNIIVPQYASTDPFFFYGGEEDKLARVSFYYNQEF